MLKYVICTRHRLEHRGRIHEYLTYDNNDSPHPVSDNCAWKGAQFHDRDEAESIIATLRNSDIDAVAQLVWCLD